LSVDALLASRGFSAMRDRVVSEGFRLTEHETDALIHQLVVIDDDATLTRLGIRRAGSHRCLVAVTSPEKPIGNVILDSNGENNFFVIDNTQMRANANIVMRFNRSQSVAFFASPIGEILNLHSVFMRSAGQWLYWGTGATAVGAKISIEGEQRGVAIGDDCMISSGVSLSNYDMHTLFDVDTEQIINGPPIDMIVEQHVWIGEGSSLMGAERIGFGGVVAGGAFVKGSTASLSVVGGLPAKVLRSNASWSRNVREVEQVTRERLLRLRSL
jgi:carbonic anhydrase/acetyltransferase-like protein (isoleucine patch superfamily)